MYAIIGDWFDLKAMVNYNYTVFAPAGAGPYTEGDYPQDRLAAFVAQYLLATSGGIVVSENWGWRRKDIQFQPWPPPRLACYGDDEVYHLLTPEITDPDLIEASIVARHQWQTNVCSSCAHVPDSDIPNEAFFDEIVCNTQHIFIPAFDGSGYLIWTVREGESALLDELSLHFLRNRS